MTNDFHHFRALGTLDTERAQAMLFKLCKHFSKKITVTFDETHGCAEFPQGQCEMSASDTQLAFACACSSEQELNALRNIIDLHVALMTRKAPQAIEWRTERDA